MATPTKTVGTVLLAHQEVLKDNTIKGTAQDVSGKFFAQVYIFHAQVEAGANTDPPRFLVQVSAASSGDEDWITIEERVCSDGTPTSVAPSGSEGAGQTVIEVSTTTGFAIDDVVYFEDSSVAADGEWGHVESVEAGTSITLMDGITTAKDTGDLLWTQAEVWTLGIPLDGIGRIRCVYQNEGATNRDGHIKVTMTTLDSIG